jgi:hypothetical protein
MSRRWARWPSREYPMTYNEVFWIVVALAASYVFEHFLDKYW